MDANKLLAVLRQDVQAARMDIETQGYVNLPEVRKILSAFFLLDSHLSAGGRPPEAWAEGPDAPELDDQALTTCPLGIPHTIQPIAAGVWGTPPTLMAGPDGPLDPLGGPVPGVDGSHLPESGE